MTSGCLAIAYETTHGHLGRRLPLTSMSEVGGRSRMQEGARSPYVLKLADQGYKRACAKDPGLAEGINVELGTLTSESVARAFNMPWEPSSVARR